MLPAGVAGISILHSRREFVRKTGRWPAGFCKFAGSGQDQCIQTRGRRSIQHGWRIWQSGVQCRATNSQVEVANFLTNPGQNHGGGKAATGFISPIRMAMNLRSGPTNNNDNKFGRLT